MKFHLGINYWPSRSGMRWWRNFDAGETLRDFERIGRAGCDSVRVFLLWEDFQPRPDRVSGPSLEKLRAVADAAGRNGLKMIPTLFTGHMSGVNWFPPWAVAPSSEPTRFRVVCGDSVAAAHPKNWFTDQLVLDAQALLAGEVAAALHDHPALWAYDLGNENSNCVIPPTRESGIAWLRRMTEAVHSKDPAHPVTIGLHGEDLEEDRLIGPREAAMFCDFLCMHGYPMYTRWARSPTDHLVLPFLGLVTRWMGGKEVLFEEFGAATAPAEASGELNSAIPLLSESGAAAYTARSLSSLHKAGMTGAMLWCYGDYQEHLWPTPPFDLAVHERYFGLWHADGSPKPAVTEIRKFTAREQNATARKPDWIDLSVDEFYRNPQENLTRWYRSFLDPDTAY